MSSVENVYAEIETYEQDFEAEHRVGAMSLSSLRQIFAVTGTDNELTLETGCGKSTICFSRFSRNHLAFCFDDSKEDRSSVEYFRKCKASDASTVNFVFGPTQKTLPLYDFSGHAFDIIFLDGPHAYPFPDLEYFFTYPHLKVGGFLIIDDVQIPSVSRMADILAEDRMYEVKEFVHNKTLVLRKTNAPTLSPYMDYWTRQDYNLRRTKIKTMRLEDGKRRPTFLLDKD